MIDSRNGATDDSGDVIYKASIPIEDNNDDLVVEASIPISNSSNRNNSFFNEDGWLSDDNNMTTMIDSFSSDFVSGWKCYAIIVDGSDNIVEGDNVVNDDNDFGGGDDVNEGR